MGARVARHRVRVDKHEANRKHLPDQCRPLIKAGQTSMSRIARSLASRVPGVSALIASLWRRALETAEVWHRQYRTLHRVATDRKEGACRKAPSPRLVRRGPHSPPSISGRTAST